MRGAHSALLTACYVTAQLKLAWQSWQSLDRVRLQTSTKGYNEISHRAIIWSRVIWWLSAL